MRDYYSVLLALSSFYYQTSASPTQSSDGSDNQPTVTLDSGVVIGTTTSIATSPQKVHKYLGVPFGAIPERFSPPQPLEPWTTPFDATNPGPACIQQLNYPETARNFSIAAFNTPAPPAGESEDCLNINIYVPAGAGHQSRRLPVLFWIYGGASLYGHNNFPTYDGSSFAANQNVIVVAANYRTNVFGFPAAPGLPIAERNPGYLDQRLALDWVQRNIAAFGGNPDLVTIFGESAGSVSVDYLVTSPPSPLPFAAAIMQSSQSSVSPQPQSNGSEWRALIAALNCSSDGFPPTPEGDLACARAAPQETLTSINEHLALMYRATPDNITVLPLASSITAYAEGRTAQVPVLLGTNANDGSIFTIGQNDTASWLTNTLMLPTDQVEAITSLYPLGSLNAVTGHTISTENDQITTIFTDVAFQCPASLVANGSLPHNPTWRYLYNATFPAIQVIPGMPEYGVFHSSEIPIVFDTYDFYVERATAAGLPGVVSEEQKRFSEYLQTSWATFAKNPTAGPGWSEGFAEAGAIHVLGGFDDGSGGTFPLERQSSTLELDGFRCQVWEPIYEAVAAASPP